MSNRPNVANMEIRGFLMRAGRKWKVALLCVVLLVVSNLLTFYFTLGCDAKFQASHKVAEDKLKDSLDNCVERTVGDVMITPYRTCTPENPHVFIAYRPFGSGRALTRK